MKKIGLISLFIVLMIGLVSCHTSFNFSFASVDSKYQYKSYEGFLEVKDEAEEDGYIIVDKELLSDDLPSALEFASVFEDMELLAYDGNQVKVNYTAIYDGKEDSVTFKTNTGKDFKFVSEWDNFTGKAYGVLYVYIPKDESFRLEFDTVSGDVLVENINYESIKGSTTSGDMDVSHLEVDQLKLDSVSGSMSIMDVSTSILDAHTTSGDCDFDGKIHEKVNWDSVSGELFINANDFSGVLKSTSGDIRINADYLRDLEMDSVSGDVILKLTEMPNAKIDFKTVSGDFTTSYDLSVNGKSDEDHVKGSYGSGKYSFNIDTTSGDLNIRK